MTQAQNGLNDGGIPANVNPFTVNNDFCISDGTLENIAPQYFNFNDDGQVAPVKVSAPAMSQREAEKLVRELFETDMRGGKSFAVKESYVHIIPMDLRSSVYISKSLGETCEDTDTYLSDLPL